MPDLTHKVAVLGPCLICLIATWACSGADFDRHQQLQVKIVVEPGTISESVCLYQHLFVMPQVLDSYVCSLNKCGLRNWTGTALSPNVVYYWHCSAD